MIEGIIIIGLLGLFDAALIFACFKLEAMNGGGGPRD